MPDFHAVFVWSKAEKLAMSNKAIAQSSTTTLHKQAKWSKALMAAGWTVMPNVIIERQRVLGLDAVDINILMHLALYWWTADNKPHPSKNTIAAAVGASSSYGAAAHR